MFDEFYGGIKLSLILQLCDRYPMQVPVKGGFVPWCPNRIIFTSNCSPTQWWKDQEVPNIEAFGRRLFRVFKMGKDEKGKAVLEQDKYCQWGNKEFEKEGIWIQGRGAIICEWNPEMRKREREEEEEIVESDPGFKFIFLSDGEEEEDLFKRWDKIQDK